MIKAVIFDIDGTLVDSFEANHEYVAEFMKASGYPSPTPEQYATIYHLSTWDVIKTLTGLTNEKGVQKIWDLAQNFEYTETKFHKLTDGAKETILKLSTRYPLGIVSNRSRKFIFESPLDTLKKYFQVSIAYEDVVNHKPHPESLLLAAEKLGVKPTGCVYIGDAETDIQAARAAGMKMVLYGQTILQGADCAVMSLKEIPKLIEQL